MACVMSAGPLEAQIIKLKRTTSNILKKGKIVGFSLIMKNLGRERIPCCKNFHRNIHGGSCDGIALTDLHSPEVATK